MALVNCYECGREVSDSAGRCPYCGVDTPGARKLSIGEALRLTGIMMLFTLIIGVLLSAVKCS